MTLPARIPHGHDDDNACDIVSNIVDTAAGYPAWLERDIVGRTVLVCGCGLRVPAVDDAAGLRLLRRHRTACGFDAESWTAALNPARVDQELAVARAELGRVDGKASAVLALAATVLSGALAILGTGRLAPVAAGVGWLAVALVAASLMLAGAAIAPQLGRGAGTGSTSFMAWATARTDEHLADMLTADPLRDRLPALRFLSRALRLKYLRLRGGVVFLGLAVPVVAIAALLNSLHV